MSLNATVRIYSATAGIMEDPQKPWTKNPLIGILTTVFSQGHLMPITVILKIYYRDLSF